MFCNAQEQTVVDVVKVRGGQETGAVLEDEWRWRASDGHWGRLFGLWSVVGAGGSEKGLVDYRTKICLVVFDWSLWSGQDTCAN
jgi:hypothetical protein